MENYTTILDVENYTLQDITDSFEPQVTSWIASVSRMMDKMCNRTLVAPDDDAEGYEDSSKYYDGSGANVLSIDDAQSISELKMGDVWGDNEEVIDSTKYVIKPKTPPISQIYLKDDHFTVGVQNVTVTGRFGLFDSLPDDIKFACTVIVAGIINDKAKGAESKKSESIGNYSVTYTDDKGVNDYQEALKIIDMYRKIAF